ncbi:arsenate reductase ArsC [Fulvimarina sp. 2208YS6-2-32]|uniref:Arsenate reductase ArsC n=1 Tax=Fulvimarina uroteuthidis TaxID=3098149 RepID=A0ABU5I0Y5_9HYPH|nr:arsenate reductase ArsC [Fulvimarina sp. 2208YS6-2-32]MDY8109051.1 arsenate reductase ArsC [Fulvimarina sp. 2208YS6-2-32]
MKNVLFLSTCNSARSVLAEAVMNAECEDRFDAFSAGSRPRGTIHPLALETLREAGYETTGLKSKSWESFSSQDAPDLHFVITLCDEAVGETCPAWPGTPQRFHWGIVNPSLVEGDDATGKAAFRAALAQIEARILAFRSLPVENMTKVALRHAMETIGTMDGASPLAADPASD